MAPRKKKAPKGMMSVYPPFDLAATLGGYRSVPFTIALRIAAQVLGDAALEVAERFQPDEWEVMRLAFALRQWEPEAPNAGDFLADAVERAQQRVNVGQTFGKGQKEGDRRIEALAGKLRACSYLEAWAVIIAVTWRSERDDVQPGDSWWTLPYRAAKIESDKPEKEG